MNAIDATIFCLAYILGLLFAGVPGKVVGIPVGAIVIFLAGVAIAFLIPQLRLLQCTVPRRWVWLTASIIGAIAIGYFQLRLPQPQSTDICHWIADAAAKTSPCSPVSTALSGMVRVEGSVTSAPRLTRSDRVQFELTVTQLAINPDPKTTSKPRGKLATEVSNPIKEHVTGKLYVTLPRTNTESLYPGLTVSISGSLYKPKPAKNPGGFNFEQYLAQQGIFAGLNGKQVIYPAAAKAKPPFFWSLRRRIAQVQEFGLGSPEGALVSAMVMGKSAVDVPFTIQDQFKQTGLAHALAASGTQVSLLLGVILALTQRFSKSVRFLIGAGVLILYLGLTGIEASVLRAGVMGLATLFALTADRKVKPLGMLLFAAVLLLIMNPIWIYDLGFQLSFLATFGLLVTAPILAKWLDWMPPVIAPLFAVPIAAYVWTLPLLLFVFGVVSPYSTLINILVSPLITVISIGGMISGVSALIYPDAGSCLAWLLYYPTHLLIKVAAWGSQLPSSQYAIGTINVVQVGAIYSLMIIIWQWKRSHRYWWLAGFISLNLVVIPIGYAATHLSQITVLATAKPVLVIQNRDRVGLIHSGSSKETQFTVLPFLQRQGINRIDWGIAPSLRTDEIPAWKAIIADKPIGLFYSSPDSFKSSSPYPINDYKALLHQIQARSGTSLPLSIGQRPQLKSTQIEQIYTRPDVLRFQVNDQAWLWLNGVPALNRQADLAQQVTSVDVLGWSGKPLSSQLLAAINPKVAIGFSEIDPATAQWLAQHQVDVHSLDQTGAIRVVGGKTVEVRSLE